MEYPTATDCFDFRVRREEQQRRQRSLLSETVSGNEFRDHDRDGQGRRVRTCLLMPRSCCTNSNPPWRSSHGATKWSERLAVRAVHPCECATSAWQVVVAASWKHQTVFAVISLRSFSGGNCCVAGHGKSFRPRWRRSLLLRSPASAW